MTTIKIEVGNATTRLWPVPDDLRAALEARFTVAAANSYFARRARPGWDGKVRFFRDGAVPTGFLAEVDGIVRDAGHAPRYVDLREKPPAREALRHVAVQLRKDYQAEDVATLFDAVRATYKAATNSGKTEVAVALTSLARARTLFLVPTVALAAGRGQTGDRFRAAFPRARVEVLTGDAELSTAAWGADVVVANVQALAARCRVRVLRWNRKLRKKTWQLGPLTKEGRAFLASFGAVFGDELHLLSSTEWSKLLRECTGAYYRWGLSATPWTEEPSRDMLAVGIFGPVVATVEQSFLMDRGYSARVTVRCLRYRRREPIGDVPYGEQVRVGIDFCPERNEVLADAVAADAARGLRVLCVAEHLEHARFFSVLLGVRGIPTAVAHGGNRAERDAVLAALERGELGAVVATRVLGTGVNMPYLDGMAVVSAGKKAARAIQNAGRLVRRREDKTEATFYDARDLGIYAPGVPSRRRFLEQHYRRRVRGYESEGFRVVEE